MGEPVRLMTVNLLTGGATAGAFERLLEHLDPDVVVAQELGIDCAAVLEERYPNHHLHADDSFDGRGIATRLEASFDDLPMAFRSGISARLDVDGRCWSLAGIHLLNPIAFPSWRSVRGRAAQLDAIRDWLDEASVGPVVVAGDFNASPRWPVYRQIADRLPDVVTVHAAARGARPDRTWAWRAGWPRLLRIDHVFGTGVEAASVAVAPIDGSDHHAVVVDLIST